MERNRIKRQSQEENTLTVINNNNNNKKLFSLFNTHTADRRKIACHTTHLLSLFCFHFFPPSSIFFLLLLDSLTLLLLYSRSLSSHGEYEVVKQILHIDNEFFNFSSINILLLCREGKKIGHSILFENGPHTATYIYAKNKIHILLLYAGELLCGKFITWFV